MSCDDTQVLEATQAMQLSESDLESPVLGRSSVDGVQLRVIQGDNVIGRGADNQIVINRPSISKYHAVIEAEHDSYLIFDKGSTNGT